MVHLQTPTVLRACLGCLGGIACASWLFAIDALPMWWTVVVVSVLVVGCVRQWSPVAWRSGAVAVIAFALGMLRFLGAVPPPADFASSTEISGRITRVESIAKGRMRVMVRTAEARVPVVVFAPQVVLRYGDIVRIRCVLAQSHASRERLTSAGTCAVRSPDAVRVLAHGAGSPTLRLLDEVHAHLVATAGASLSPRAYAVVASAVLGDRGALPDELRDAFRKTGTIHALVISGGHMTIIGMLLLIAFRVLPVTHRAARWSTLVALGSFVAMTGFTPSAVRGALMVAAFIAVELLGRVASRLRVLVLVATTMVVVHPHVLAFDLGFQLSFAAVAGIVLMTPLLERAIPRASARTREITSGVATSLAATIATAPLLFGAFGTISLIGVLANIPVLLLLPALLIAAFAFLLIGALLPSLAPLAAWPVDVLARSVVWLVERAAAVPWASVDGVTLDWWFTLALYVALTFVVLRAASRCGMPLLSPFRHLSTDAALLTGGTLERR
ncbi:MAG: ComEC/Rec2 family competence protein [bacterium]|nr:ComEC/Rec2 family competence protein [bacterium]